ncbi:MAG: DUF2087 domain-containing protein [Marinibacterium sp.]|nr:DUF2087 domain-containing protein [Marinibacterium sp.]
MPRQDVPLYIADLSGFTKSLRKSLSQTVSETDALPGHQAMMGLVARAAGHRNIQTLRAAQPAPPVKPSRALKRARQVFDAQGRMIRWPSQTAVQGLCCWVFWARLPARQDLSEPQVNDILRDGNLFGDHVQLRRGLVEHKLVTRTVDGRIYRRLEQAPPPDARDLIRTIPVPPAGA